jgi:hypothetical protein
VSRRPQPPLVGVCYLATFGAMEHGDPMPGCDGRLVRVHLIPRQVIKREGGNPWDQRGWVWACGGAGGNGGHHGMLDHSRKLRLTRSVIPQTTEQLASELGLTWWLDREYGMRET